MTRKEAWQILCRWHFIAKNILDELKSLGLIDEVYLGVFRADYQDGGKVNWYTKTIPDSSTPDFHIPSAFQKIFLK